MSRSKVGGSRRIDASNVAGITTLLNPQHLRPGINLFQAEKNIMGSNSVGVKNKKNDPVELYTSELNRMAEELGIDLLEDNDHTKQNILQHTGSSVKELIDDVDFSNETINCNRCNEERENCVCDSTDSDSNKSDSSDSSVRSNHSVRSNRSDRSDRSNRSDRSDRMSSKGRDDRMSSKGRDDRMSSKGRDDRMSSKGRDDRMSSKGRDDRNKNKPIFSGIPENSTDNSRNILTNFEKKIGMQVDNIKSNKYQIRSSPSVKKIPVTEEQERRRHIKSVVSDMRDETRTTFGVERERIQDIKASKIEQISQLRTSLDEDGVDCSSVATPTADSPIEEIDSTLNILKHKNDRNRYSTLAEEVILGFAGGIEKVFDGSRAIPIVGWKPDYTDYHNTVNVKLHRMRFETATVVGSVIEKYNIGPLARITMELLPSFFLYPQQQQTQRGVLGLSSDPRVADATSALNTIRRSNDRNLFDDLTKI